MSKAEQKYKYLLNKDKYDPEVNKAVGKKSITHSEANKINAIQEMMRNETNLKNEFNTGKSGEGPHYEHKRNK